VNGDGMTDAMAFKTDSRELSAVLLQSDGSYVRETVGRQTDPQMRPVGYGDVDNDGQADVLWRNNVSGDNEIWLMRDTSMMVLSLPNQPVDWKLMSFRDWNNDGRADVLWHKFSTGETSIWTLSGNGRGTVLAVDPAPADMSLAGAADLNKDGRPDLIWHDRKTRAVEGWLMSGATPTATFTLPDAPKNAQLAGVGDLDADGDDDLVWLSSKDGKRVVRAWFVNGMQAPQQGVALALSSKRKFRGVLDMNSDGHLDIVTAKGGAFTAFTIAPTAMAAASKAEKPVETQWTYMAIPVSGIKSDNWAFLIAE
jgi:hypothetical protein